MVGISYPGITQLFVAGTRPPHLAAITPLSVLDDTYDTLYPGGIFNNGFALGLGEGPTAATRNRRRSAAAGSSGRPSASPPATRRCRDNQKLRLQAANVTCGDPGHPLPSRSRPPTRSAPATFVPTSTSRCSSPAPGRTRRPASHFANMLGDFSPDIPLKITLMNGLHQDSLGPAVLSRWVEFLDFYVARKIPSISPATRFLAIGAAGRASTDAGVTLAPDRFTDQPDYAAALKAVRGGARGARAVRRRRRRRRSHRAVVHIDRDRPGRFPTPPPTTYYLGADGALTKPAPTSVGARLVHVRALGVPPHHDDGGLRRPRQQVSPAYGWKPVPAGKALAYVTAPLTADTVMAGTGSVDLWVQATQPDVDLEVTISEVRPDGQETYVQSGWLRASQRALDAGASTALLPVQTHRRADVAPLPTGKAATPTEVRVPLYPFAHPFRAGFADPDRGAATGRQPALVGLRHDPASHRRHRVHRGRARAAATPSKVVLPVVSGIDVSTPLPKCGSLRGQPCRAYVPLDNRSPA